MNTNDIITNEDEVLDEWATTHPGIKKELKKKGYKLLGSGVDQTAFLEPGTGYVLKIFGTSDSIRGKPAQFSDAQKMFFKWAKFCMRNADNKFLPKFFGYESFVYDDSNYLQIKQELLTKSGKWGDAISRIADQIVWQGKTPAALITQTKQALTSSQRKSSQKSKITNDHDTAGRDDDDWDYEEYENLLFCAENLGISDTAVLLKTIGALGKICDSKGWDWDLHEDNIMCRGKTPVIIDPWVA